ncbi:alpha/beta fold hydrolase [Zavarzinia sp. CC-PAN008]|uniref:alpha/beta fold hydrolase n=1 Tax=Zavarzinia sp. CC-PAN008 TaxID=3243332 RepID=UPI003F749A0A
MARFNPNGVEIVFDGVGDGAPVLMIHGFATDRRITWRAAGWFDAVIASGREAFALDLRGHGESGKPHDTASYTMDLMAADVLALLDRYDLQGVDLIAHSLGARLGLHLLARHGARFGRAVLIGIGGTVLDPPREPSAMIHALETDDPKSVTDAFAASFRTFADASGGDRAALVSCLKGLRIGGASADLAAIRTPVLVLGAEQDPSAGPADRLAQAIPGAVAQTVPGTSHHSILQDGMAKAAAFQFLRLRPKMEEEDRWRR